MAAAIDSFLTDRRTKNRAPGTIKHYRSDLHAFAEYVNSTSHAEIQIQEIGSDLLRAYLHALRKSRNEGGVHAAYRALRAFLRWVEREEFMPSDWKNPIQKVDAPFVPKRILEPVPLEDIQSLLATCRGNAFFDRRDKAIFFFLLDTGARA